MNISLFQPTTLRAHPPFNAELSTVLTDTGTIHLPILIHAGIAEPAPTATSTTAATPLPTDEIEWDPRLDQRGALLVPAQPAAGQGYWRLIRGQWFDEQESGGRVNIFVDTLDENGARQTDVPLLVSWADGETTIVTEAKPGEPAANFAMFTWAPAYDIRPNDGHPADRVNGLGLGSIEQPRFNIHTSYEFIWQWTIHNDSTPTPLPTDTPTLPPTDTPTMTPSITPTTTISITPEVSPTETLTNTPTVATTTQPTPLPTTTPIPTSTSLPTPTSTPMPTTLATPVVDTQFVFSRGELVDCIGDPSQIRVNGTIFVNNEPAPGYLVFFNFQEADNEDLNPVTSRNDPPGFYEHIISSHGQWYVWVIEVVEGRREQISVRVPFSIDEAKDECRIATVNFYSD